MEIKWLARQADIGQSRTSTVNPLQWALVILLVGMIMLLVVGAPPWLIILLAVLVAAVFVAFCVSFFFLLFKNPDALRSETYSLSKYAIDKGLYGDSLVGVHEMLELPGGGPVLPPGDDDEEQAESK